MQMIPSLPATRNIHCTHKCMHPEKHCVNECKFDAEKLTGGLKNLTKPELETILQEAQRLVHGDRGEDYGHPYHDFSRTAGMLNALFRHKLKDAAVITAQDIGIIMVCVKLSRQMNKPKRDNLVDGAGYMETIDMIEQYLYNLNPQSGEIKS